MTCMGTRSASKVGVTLGLSLMVWLTLHVPAPLPAVFAGGDYDSFLLA